MNRSICTCALMIVLSPAFLFADTIFVAMNGANEFPGPGDANASATGSITLDAILDTVSWSFNYSDIDGTTLSGFHIHGPDGFPGVAKGIFVGLTLSTTATPNGTLTGTLTTANIADLATRIDTILGAPLGFYLNIHSTPSFPGGAVRGQLPEPSTMVLAAIGGLALALRFARMRRRA